MLHLNFHYPESDDYWDSIFNDGVLDPKSWIDTATELACTLNYLRTPAIDFFKATRSTLGQALPMNKRVHGCYLMIAGFVAENLLKAIVAKAASSQGTVDPTDLLKEIKTHNLLKLAAKAGMPVTDSGRELLQRLTYFAVWAGRYPTPVSVADFKPQAISGAEKNTLNYVRGSDIRAIDQLFHTVKKCWKFRPS
ncbi:hypothetical protein PWR05_32870 [Paraburkholderia sp. A2RI-6]|uniref:hypothetical protein n=1 Tax=Paraburkholderia sp. A2RI-6 TaxID=3028371 RepID=UPI003B7B9D45